MSRGNGEVLGGFPLSEGEQKGITIDDAATQELRAKGSKCLVGRLGVPKKLNKEADWSSGFQGDTGKPLVIRILR